MNTNLSTTYKIDYSKLVFNNYFQTYIEEACRVGLISKVEVLNIQMMLVKLLEVQIQRYTRFESSSVKTETAGKLMRSILYNLDFKFKRLKEEEGVYLLKTQSVESLFREGVVLVKEQVEKSRFYLKKLQNNRLKVDNFAYNDTIDHGFTNFYPYYEPEFSAHLSPVDIDYPLYHDSMKEEGIEYVYGYLKKLYYENEFCSYFKIEEINQLLESSHPHHKELLVNIFEVVLINALGRVLVNKDLTSLVLNESDCIILKGEFENIKLPLELLQVGAIQIIDSFKIEGFLKQYIVYVLPNIASRIAEAMVNNTLDKVFVLFKDTKDHVTVAFKDGVSLADDDFKAMMEEIRGCDDIRDKLVIFKENIHSLKDMIDFLESECLYDQEYKAVYATLSEIEMALLLKVLAMEDEACFNVRLQEVRNNEILGQLWECELLDFLDTREEGIRQRLWQIVQNIKIEE